jgi:hypothetical protein
MLWAHLCQIQGVEITDKTDDLFYGQVIMLPITRTGTVLRLFAVSAIFIAILETDLRSNFSNTWWYSGTAVSIHRLFPIIRTQSWDISKYDFYVVFRP